MSTHHIQVPLNRQIHAIFLIAGTCIGAGMLALPIETGFGGFIPSFVVMLVCYLFMLFSALLLVEANLWMQKEDAHFATMASKLLGRWGKYITILIYLLMAYGSLIVYSSAGSFLIANGLHDLTSFTPAKWEAILFFCVVFSAIIYFGTGTVGRVNSILVFAMLLMFIFMISLGLKRVNFGLLSYMNWKPAILAFPLMLSSFSFQMMLPSLTPYLNRSPYHLRLAVIYGVSIPFIVYLVWEMVVLGIFPIEGEMGLRAAFLRNYAATEAFKQQVGFIQFSWFAEFFALFAVATSFLGIGLGLFDFLGDLMKVSTHSLGKVLLIAILALPVLFVTMIYPDLFLMIMGLTGGFGDTILSGLLAILMVWNGRYYLHNKNAYEVPGKKPSLYLAGAFFLFIICVQLYQLI